MTTIFSNRKAAFLWGFAAVWMTVLILMTYVLFRDGPPDGYAMPEASLVAGLFWIGGLGFVVYVASKPCISVTIDPAGAAVCWRYPHKVVRRTIPAAGIVPAQVVESRDDEGEPYFYARVGAAEAGIVDLHEGHSRSDCELVCARFNAALKGR